MTQQTESTSPLASSRRNKNLRRMLQIFIGLSLLLHFVMLGLWILPDKIAESRKLAAKERLRREAVERRENQKRAEAEARQKQVEKAVEITRTQAVEDLKFAFNNIVGQTIKSDAAEDLWREVLQSIQGDVDMYAQAAGDAAMTDQEVLQKAQEMQAQMMEELLARLKGISARHLADAYIKQIEAEVLPKIAEYYRKQLDSRIAQPLSAEGSRIAREEASAIRTARQQAGESLTRAEQGVRTAVTELTGAKNRLNTAIKQAGSGKNPTTVPAATVAQERGAVDRATAALKQAEGQLNEAMGKHEMLGGGTVKGIRTSGFETGEVTSAVTSVVQAIDKSDAAGASKTAGDAVAAATKLATDIHTVKDGIAKDGLDPNIEVRAGLRDARDTTIKGELDRSFQETFVKTTAPRLSDKLTNVFADGLERAGAKDDKIIAEVKDRIQVALNDKVGGGVDAGDVGTDRLTKTENLDGLPGDVVGRGSGTGDGKDGRGRGGSGTGGDGKGGNGNGDGKGGDDMGGAGGAGGRLTAAARDLVKGRMGDLEGTGDDGAGDGTGDGKGGNGKHGNGNGKGGAGGDGEGDGDGSGDGSGGPRGRRGVVATKTTGVAKDISGKAMEGIANDASGDGAFTGAAGGAGGGRRRGNGNGGEGDGEDGIDAGMLDRLAQLRDGLRSGRMNLLDGGGAGMGAGAGAGAGGGAGKLGGGGGGMGGGYNNSSLSRLAQIRRQALVNGQIARTLNRSYRIDEGDYAKVTAGIHERDQNAARGTALQRVGASGEVQLATAVQDLPSSKIILLPKASDGELIGKPHNANPFKPSFTSIAFAAIPFRNKPIVIDGDLSEWKDIPALPMVPTGEGMKNAGLRKPPEGVKVQWDSSAIYIAYDVIDPDNKITQCVASDFWGGDGIEVWLDPQNVKAKERTADTHQFWAWAIGTSQEPGKVGGEAYADDKRTTFTSYGPDRLPIATKKTAEGWTIEMRIPIQRLRNTQLTPGRIIGMNFSICTGAQIYYYWAGKTDIATAMRPDTWGDVMLAGSDGRLECIDKLVAEGAAPGSAKQVHSQRIGEPLRIRVTDMDMNLSDARKDRVSVTVLSRRGDREVVVLEETGEKTGVFEGSIGTTLDAGDPVPGVLSLFDGEKFDVVYTDQARGNGARDVEVKLTLPTAAAVTAMAAK